MKSKVLLKGLVCGGTLLSSDYLRYGSGMASAFLIPNSTGTVLHSRRTAEFDKNTTTASTDDDDERINIALSERLGKASNGFVKKLQTIKMDLKKVLPNQKYEQTLKSFTKNKLGDIPLNELFTHPNFILWTSNTVKRYKYDEKKAYDAMYLILLKNVKNQKELTEWLGSTSARTLNMLGMSELNYWKVEKKFTLEDLYDFLELGSQKAELLDSKKFGRWMDYAVEVKENALDKLWLILSHERNDQQIVELLRKPRTTGNAQHVGRQLESKLVSKWILMGYTNEKVLQHLGMSDHEVTVWLTYLSTVKKDAYALMKSMHIIPDIETVLQSQNEAAINAAKIMHQEQKTKRGQAGVSDSEIVEAS
ncbi:hypothetical protein Plhal703r1_c04g0022221 [Plasmopara halstedii]